MDKDLFRLAERYHKSCDSFDAMVCSGERNGEPWPMTHKERALINDHAETIRRLLINGKHDFSAVVIDKAIQRYPEIV